MEAACDLVEQYSQHLTTAVQFLACVFRQHRIDLLYNSFVSILIAGTYNMHYISSRMYAKRHTCRKFSCVVARRRSATAGIEASAEA